MPTGYPSNLHRKEFVDQICLLYSQGLTTAQIEQRTGWHHSTVARILRKHKIMRPPGMIGRRHSDAAKKAVGDANRRIVTGDRYLTNGGYTLVYQPEHPHTRHDGMVMEHRLVMEQMLGRYLLLAEVVHHINGVKHDNAETNLQLFGSISTHSKHHAPSGRKLSEETRRKMSESQKRAWKEMRR